MRQSTWRLECTSPRAYLMPDLLAYMIRVKAKLQSIRTVTGRARAGLWATQAGAA